MAHNTLELVVEIDTNRANASIKSINTSLSSMGASATKSAKGATQGIDGMTAAHGEGRESGEPVHRRHQGRISLGEGFHRWFRDDGG